MSFLLNGDAVTQGNIIFTTFAFFQYCNAVYNSSGNGSEVDSSTGSTAFDSGSPSSLSALVEGPYKFLFNTVAYGLYCRSNAQRTIDTRSILYNYVGEWNTSWTMYSDAILDDEMIKYFVNISSDNNKIKLGRDLMPSYQDISSYYKAKLSEALPDYHRQKISKMDTSNIEFYIEVTNPDVAISNASDFSSSSQKEEENIPSSYFLKKMSSNLLKPYAYTDKYCSSIKVPDEFGPYVIKDVPGISSSDTKKINNNINPVTEFKSYPFTLQTNYSYISATEKPVVFNGTLTANVKFNYTGKVVETYLEERVGSVKRNWSVEVPGRPGYNKLISEEVNIPGTDHYGISCINIKSSIDKNLYNVLDSDKSYNNFLYTGDINLGNSTNMWSTAYSGKVHRYVKYLQVAMKATGRYGAGNFANWPVDGKYGPKTKTAIESFQQTQKNFGNCLYVDGTVDSETKSLIARRLKTLEIEDIASYNRWRTVAHQYGVLDFWDAAVNAVTADEIGIGPAYKKISFTGFEGTTRIADTIYFSIPEGYEQVRTLSIDFGFWKKAKVIAYGFSDADHISNGPLTTTQRNNSYNTAIINRTPDENGIVNIALNLPYSSCRHMYIKIESSEKLKTLNGIFGDFAEGYSLQRIYVSARTAGTYKPPVYQWIDPVAGYSIPQPTITYEAVDSLTSAPDVSEIKKYFNGRPIREFLTNYLYFDNGLKSSIPDKRIYVRGSKLGKGYYKWNGSSWDEEELFGSDEIIIEDYTRQVTVDVQVEAYATVTENFAGLSPQKPWGFTYDLASCRKKALSFTSLKYNYKGQNYTQNLPTDTNLTSGEFITDQGVTFNFGDPKGETQLVSNSSVSISSLVSDTGQTVGSPSTVVSIAYSSPIGDGGYQKIDLSTSSTYYSGSKVVNTPKYTIDESKYNLITLDGTILDNRQSVTVHDGICLLAQKGNNLPVGIPSYSDIVSSFTSLSAGVQEDIRLGELNVYNTLPDQEGLIFGFYDKEQKEFIGKKIFLFEILSRGLKNIYLAVCAIDADGNAQNKVDYLGPKVTDTFKPVNIPLRKIYPVYSVRFNSNSRIRLGNMSLSIEKNKAWPLPVSQGSFVKPVYLSSNIYSDWKANYINQELLCYYETFATPGVTWSKIFGRGHYEIKDENPEIVSSSVIKVRQAPFLVWGEPSNYEYSLLKLIRPQFEIYKNTNTQATKPSEKVWQKIPLSKVENYNAQTGVIEFTERLVPSNEQDIKISYVSKNSDIHIYQVSGDEIPLNPLLNKSTIQLNKPLYVYLMPSRIDKRSNVTSEFSGYSKVTEYSNSYPVNVTYDKNIFNPTSNSYNPFALLIGMVFYNRDSSPVKIFDTRLRGGGISYNKDLKDVMQYTKNAISYWDTYPSHGMAYPKGGYVIIKLPKEVKDNFLNITEIYDIVYRNLTAGVSFEIQDMDGNPFGVL